MNKNEVGMSLSIAEQLIDITPEIIEELNNVTVSAVFNDYLHLAVVSDIDRLSHGNILRYEPTAKSWEELYSSKVELQGGSTSFITSFSKDGGTEIFASFGSSYLIHSTDGKNFSPISEENEVTFKQLINFKNHLYALPEQVTAAIIYTSDNLKAWEPVVIPNFIDSDNTAIAEIAVFNDSLYIGTSNLQRGFEIWKQDDSTWKPLITEGARGYISNATVSSMVVFQGNLYAAVGTPTKEGTYITGTEIIRIYPDDSWDLIIGKPKFTPDGLKVPLSLIGTGFDELSDCTLQFMTVHQDCLYAGTRSDRGLQFWVSEDGENWNPFRIDNLSDRSKIDINTVVSTPFGLVTVVQEDGEVSILLASS